MAVLQRVLKQVPAPPGTRALPTLRVLVVEDDAAVDRLLGVAFEQAGFAVTKARSVAAARTALTLVPFDACVIDMHLPDGTGLELLRALRTMNADLPVVMLSGVRQDALIATTMRLGAKAYVTKPFSPTKLTAIVRQWIRPDPQMNTHAGALSSSCFICRTSSM